MATISERLAYILTFDTSSGVKSVQKFGQTADNELSKADKKLDQLGSNMQKVGAGMLAFAGVAGVGLFKMASGANDAHQNMQALKQVVDPLVATQLEKWADGSAEKVGLASKEAVAAVTSFAQLGKQANLSGTDLGNFSTGLVEMAADFAAFKNVSPQQALQDIRSGFSGSVEVMRKYGIFLDDITLKQAFFRETGERVTGTLTGQQKIIAVNSELYRQGADMLGQWGRESSQLQGQIAQLKANLTNLSDNIGAGILPTVITFIGAANNMAAGVASVDENTGGMIGTITLAGTAFIGMSGAVLVAAGSLIKARKEIAKIALLMPAVKGAAIGLGVVGATVFAGMALDARQSAQEIKELGEALDNLKTAEAADKGRRFAESLIKMFFAAGDVNDHLDELVRTQPALVEEMLASERATGALTKSMIENGSSQADAKVAVGLLTDATDRQSQAYRDSKANQEASTRAQENATEAIDDTGESLADEKKALDDVKQAADASRRAHEDLTDALREAQERTDALREASMALADADIAQRQAQIATMDAVDAYIEVAGNAESTNRDLEKASLAVESAVYREAAAAVEVARKLAEAEGKTLSAGKEADIYRTKVDELATSLGVSLGENSAAIQNIRRLERAAVAAGNAAAEAERKYRSFVSAANGVSVAGPGPGGTGVGGGSPPSSGPNFSGGTDVFFRGSADRPPVSRASTVGTGETGRPINVTMFGEGSVVVGEIPDEVLRKSARRLIQILEEFS